MINNSKKNIISKSNAGENINFKDASVDRSNNKLTDNSKEITKVTHKHFKKSKKKNSIPKHEQPTFDNGGFIDKIDEFYVYQQLEPEYDISFIRPNLELLYQEQKSVSLTTMFTYVNKVGSNSKDILLNNLCSESMFLSDHVWVKYNEELEMRIGQCVKFEGMVYEYTGKNKSNKKDINKYDKYSVHVFNVRDIYSSGPNPMCIDININNSIVKMSQSKFNDMSPTQLLYSVMSLKQQLDELSKQIFGNDKFIIGMIFDFYYMKSRNKVLSTDKILYDIDRRKNHFLLIFSDILYRLRFGKITDFKQLQTRVLEICLMLHQVPSTEDGWTVENKCDFYNFCVQSKIKALHGRDIHYNLIYRDYPIRKIRNNKSDDEIRDELLESVVYTLCSLER